MSMRVLGHREQTHERRGDCHRCGWTQSLRRVTPEEALVIRSNSVTGPRSGLRWLCGDCITELTSVREDAPTAAATGPVGLATAYARHRSAARNRSVA